MNVIDRYKIEDAHKFLESVRGKPQERDGFYVNGRYYGLKRAQAIARAEHLTSEYDRKVGVVLVMPGAASTKTDLPVAKA